MSAVLSFTVVMENTGACPNCGIEVILPSNLARVLRENKRLFYCPSGHPQSFTESEVDRLRRALEKKEQELETARKGAEFARSQRDHDEVLVYALRELAALDAAEGT